MITATITAKRQIAGVTASFVASAPPGGMTVQGYLQALVEQLADSLAEETSVDRISVAEFVMRFPGVVMDECKARESIDPVVAAILAELRAVNTVRLGHPTTTQGVGYLVSAGLLTQAQADVVLHYEIPAAE